MRRQHVGSGLRLANAKRNERRGSEKVERADSARCGWHDEREVGDRHEQPERGDSLDVPAERGLDVKSERYHIEHRQLRRPYRERKQQYGREGPGRSDDGQTFNQACRKPEESGAKPDRYEKQQSPDQGDSGRRLQQNDRADDRRHADERKHRQRK